MVRPGIGVSCFRASLKISVTVRDRSSRGTRVPNIIPSFARAGALGPVNPTAEKTPATSGWASIHASSRFRYSRDVSSAVPWGVSSFAKKIPSSAGGKNSTPRRAPNATARAKEPSARATVLLR